MVRSASKLVPIGAVCLRKLAPKPRVVRVVQAGPVDPDPAEALRQMQLELEVSA